MAAAAAAAAVAGCPGACHIEVEELESQAVTARVFAGTDTAEEC